MKLDLAGTKEKVRVSENAAAKWAEDGKLLSIVGYEEWSWRHLDTMQLGKLLTAKVARGA